MTELQLFDAPGADVAQITTSGDVIKPFLESLAVVGDEMRFSITSDGIDVKVADPANVYMADVSIGAEAFDTFDVKQEADLGVNVSQLKSLVRRARKNHDDELQLAFKEREVVATVARGYDNHNVVSQGSMDLIDPDAIRQEPTIPDLEREVSITVNTDPFKDALSYGVGLDRTVEIAVKGVNQHTNALYIGSETDTRNESAAIDGIESEAIAEALYSKDYLNEIMESIGAVSPSEITLTFDDEMPASFKMERDNVPMTVHYHLAPRAEK